MSSAFDLAMASVALIAALALRPLRALPPSGPPWPWLFVAAVMPLLWSVDRLVAIPALQPLSGACLLMLMAGWPLAVLAMAAVALVLMLVGVPGPEAVHRLVWLGLLPATFTMVFGAVVRRWLPHHLIVYILGRGFASTVAAVAAAGMLSAWLDVGSEGLDTTDLMLGRWLAAWGDATLCGMLVAIFVAFRPQWLATYSDRIYLAR